MDIMIGQGTRRDQGHLLDPTETETGRRTGPDAHRAAENTDTSITVTRVGVAKNPSRETRGVMIDQRRMGGTNEDMDTGMGTVVNARKGLHRMMRIY
jgi:hypothetical protein